MKILSWNVRGCGSKEKRKAIKELICKVNQDIIILQEIKKASIDRRFIGSIWRSRFKGWILQEAIGRSGGTLVVWDTRSVSVIDSLVGDFSVSIFLKAEGKEPWWLSRVYGPVVYGKRERFWDELAGLSAIYGNNWCVGGDFNVVRRVDEKLNSKSNTRSMNKFDALIRELKLVDPKLQNGRFTWSNFRLKPVWSRLDRFLHTLSWSGLYSFIPQEVMVRIVSDHIPVVLDMSPPSWGPAPFRFDNSWLEHKEFSSYFKKWWESAKVHGWPGCHFMSKLAMVRDKIKKWSREVFEARKVQKFALERSARKARNFISRIEEEDGTVWVEDKDIEKAILGFYSALYSAIPREWIGVEGISWSPISAVMASFLERPFEEDEIKQAVFACDGSKSPGPNGFSMAVYQNNWDVVKNDLLAVFQDFFQRRCWRGVLSDTIAESQGAFVEGRQILDTVLIANEAVEEYRSKGRKGWVFKIDFTKSYDCVDWGFLDSVMKKKGFGDLWRRWIRGCLSSTSFSIFLNGHPRGKFKGSRGLRQGDSLSPFLFTLVADVLGRMIDTAKSKSAFRGFSVGKDNMDVSHLQFVDDTIFFVNDKESLVVLLEILKVFSVVSGLSINLQKCQLLGINLNEEIVERQAKEIGCEVGQWPIQYLGLPLGDSPRSKGFWEPVISKCANRLDSWKSAFLSRGGRLTLIQSVLSSIPVYYLSLLCIPKSVVGIIEKLMRDFLWEGAEHSGADHLVSWNEVCKSRSYEGLGIGNLALRNKAFLFKWLWWFPMESTSLWHGVVRSRYGSDGGHWDTNVGGRFSTRGPWKEISALYEEYRSLVYFKVGRGDRIRFWEDVWIGDSSFKQKYPNLFRVSEAKNFLIKDVVVGEEINSSEGLCLNFRFRRNLFDWEIPSLVELFNLIKFVDLPQILEDKRIWILDTSGVFNCKTAFQSLSCANLGPELPWAKRLWKSVVPYKVKVFGWLLFSNKLSVFDILQRRRPFQYLSPSWCVCCKNNGESITHLFLECSFSTALWSKVLKEFGVSWCMLSSWSHLFLCQLEGEKKMARLWQSTVMATFWVIWLERNSKIFDESSCSVDSLWDKIRFWVATWVYRSKGFEDVFFLDLCRE
ncbi:uncharacterized protein LOC133820653 [Humulus lupulus]|uniref:uncharacterized protein LOC133820653 n=1 Tax=Humulus lupulus TaxID=3486 RepID=UPI002B4015D6|nr:uncharacterized protein LOC133820653 [Humulus lupulus]